MSIEIIKGIVIKSINYDENDKIITILSKNEIITFIALGVRKIDSKNRVSLQLGNVIEAEIFRSRLSGKISKLKRSILVYQPPIFISDTSLVLLSIIKQIKNIKSHSKRLFSSYLEGIEDMGQEYNHNFKTYVLFRLLDVEGNWPSFGMCVECFRKDMIVDFELSKGGFLCNLHSFSDKKIKVLQGYKNIGKSWKEYKNTDPKTNHIIQNELINFLNKNYFYYF